MNSSHALPRSISSYYHSSGIAHTLCVIVPIVIIVIMGVIEAIKTACICNLASILQLIVSLETTHRIARVSRSPDITLCKMDGLAHDLDISLLYIRDISCDRFSHHGSDLHRCCTGVFHKATASSCVHRGRYHGILVGS